MASRKTDSLIDAIGQIDGRFIEEARSVTPAALAGYRRQRKGKRILPVLLAAAVAAAVILPVMIGLMVRDKSGQSMPSGTVAGILTGGTESPSSGAVPAEDILAAELLSLPADALSGHRTEPDVPPADGVCRLVWTTGDGNYYGVSVTDPGDLETLAGCLDDPASFVPAPDGSAYTGGLRFWICTGNGLSVSPYLLYGAFGAGNLFDYSPETVPSPDFASFLVRLIRGNLD